MSSDLCKNCGKPPLAGRAGSVTSYFFQHNYCQCNANRQAAARASSSTDAPVCENCGKSRPTDKRAGSFTSFLFKELRCSCSGTSGKSRANSGKPSSRTLTSDRLAQKRQFTESIKQKEQSGDLPAPINIPRGTIIGGNYRVLSQIGLGGMGVVYLVEQTALNKQFALKVLAPDLVNEQTWQRFKSEAKTMASLQHPSFVKVYDLGIHADSLPFYSMDFLSGQSLEEILTEEGPLALKQALNIFIETLNGLAYAHRNGIIHRDIKPANIMLCTTSGATTVKILDFGISKLTKSSINAQSITMAGDIFGSPYYMSPEQCAGETIDARADIYSIGCTLFEVLTGYVPFEGSTSLETILMHQEDRVPLLGDLSQNIFFDKDIEAVMATCLAKLPRDRYQSAKELAIDLERIKSGNSIQESSPAFRQLDKVAERLDHLGESAGSPGLKTSAKIIIASTLAAVALLLTGTIYFIKPALKAHTAAATEEASESEIHDFRQKLPASASRESEEGKLAYFSEIVNKKILFNFPTDKSIGGIGLADQREKLKSARSIVDFPAKNRLQFRANEYILSHPEIFDSFRADDIHTLKIPGDAMGIRDFKEALPHIVKLTGLKEISVPETRFADQDLVELDKLPNLTAINVDSTNVTAQGLSNLQRLPKLKILHFSTSKNHGILLKALQGSTALQELYLDSLETPLSEDDARLIASCKNIERLSLEASVASDKVVKIICTLPKLKYIDLEYCIVSAKAIAEVKKTHPIDLMILHKTDVIPKSDSLRIE